MLRITLALLIVFPSLVFLDELAAQDTFTVHGDKVSLDAIRDLPALEGQRFKPFDSFAREWVRRITGKEKLEKQDPIAVFLTWRSDPDMARTQPFIKIPSAETAEALGLPYGSKGSERVSYDRLTEIGLPEKALAIHEEIEPKARSTAQNKIVSLYSQRYRAFADLAGLSGDSSLGAWLPIIPPAGGMTPGEAYRWGSPLSSISELGRTSGEMEPIRAAVSKLDSSFKANDDAAFSSAASELKNLIAALGYPEQFAGASAMAREVSLNKAHPFDWAGRLYVLAAFFAVIALLKKNRILWGIPVVIGAVGIAVQSWGMWERTVLSERALIGNFFESMVFVAAALALFGLVFELIFRKGWYQLAGAAMGWLTLSVATSNPDFMDPSIATLQPVLINNYWIHIHVPTIMSSYAALGLAAVLGHFYLFRYIVQGHKKVDMREMARFIFWLVPVGVILLFAGIILGGIWADDSWGRFWGWDPKETSALITWIAFMVVIHGRWAGWLKDFGTALGTLIGGWALLWTYYGANFFQTGMHSYAGANSSKEVPLWLWSFIAFELVVIAAATLRWSKVRNLSENKAAADETSQAA